MKKMFLLIILCIMLFGCSSPQERLETASLTISDAKIIYRSNENINDVSEYFVLKNNTEMVFVIIDDGGYIRRLERIPLEEILNKEK